MMSHKIIAAHFFHFGIDFLSVNTVKILCKNVCLKILLLKNSSKKNDKIRFDNRKYSAPNCSSSFSLSRKRESEKY